MAGSSKELFLTFVIAFQTSAFATENSVINITGILDPPLIITLLSIYFIVHSLLTFGILINIRQKLMLYSNADPESV